jgi:hypothetical protein
MSEFKVLMDRTEKNRLCSEFYKSSDHTPLREVSYKGRKWRIEAFGDCDFIYKDERYYCLSEIDEIKTDDDYEKAFVNDEIIIHMNNWYEIRPVEEKYWDYVQQGLYDDVFGDPNELDQDTLDHFLEMEKTYG